MNRGIHAALKVVAAMAVAVVGGSIGTHMHGQVMEHDAALRTPGSVAERNIQHKMEMCLRTSDPQRCFILVGIAI